MYVVLRQADTAIEVRWKAATTAGANNGISEWWVNGVQQTGLSGLDTDLVEVDYVRLGAQGTIANSRGTIYDDSFISRRLNYQGLGNDLTVTSDQFVYDGDGNRVKASANGITTVYIGNWYEKTGSVIKKYYYAGSNRVAMNVNGVVKYLFGDHLGSTNVIADANGVKLSENLYKPWGEDRYTWGTAATTFGLTGQRADGYINLYWYGSRSYDPELGRWIQPDQIIPEAYYPLAYDRYQYSYSNPIKYIDPDGHKPSLPPRFRSPIIPVPERTSLSEELVNFTSEETPELTDWLLSTMMENQASETVTLLAQANAQGQKVETYSAWYETVKGGGPWDFKVELNDYEVSSIQLGDFIVPYDTLANIHYGYEGRAAGFSYLELQAGAGVAQIQADTSDWSYCSTYFDAPMDNLMIQMGGWLFDKYGNQTLTEDMLDSAFDKFLRNKDKSK